MKRDLDAEQLDRRAAFFEWQLPPYLVIAVDAWLHATFDVHVWWTLERLAALSLFYIAAISIWNMAVTYRADANAKRAQSEEG
jgi:hypothetical protein